MKNYSGKWCSTPPTCVRVSSSNLVEQFNSLSEKETGNSVGVEGYPDDGNGFYSRGLSYGDWVQLNVMHRIKANNVEQIGFVAPFSVSFILHLFLYGS